MIKQPAKPAELHKTIRAVAAFIVAIIAGAIAVKGFQPASLLMLGLIVLVGALLLSQVGRALREVHEQTAIVRRSAQRAEEHYVSVLRRVVRFSEARDRQTRGRGERIGKLAECIARRLKLPTATCHLLNLAGQLHDIGMLAVPEMILHKRNRLGADDFRTLQKHAEISFEVLEPLAILQPILPAIRYHHERMNGTGYPMALAGENIPIEARILAVADTYDAMTHDRPHRTAMTPLEAMRELRRCCPAGYDEQCVEALAEIVNLAGLEAIDKPHCHRGEPLACDSSK